MIGRNVARALQRTAAPSASTSSLVSARSFQTSAAARKIIASQPLRAKEAPSPVGAAKGYSVIDHE